MHKISRIVGNIERDTLLPYRKKSDFMSKLDLIWPIFYDSAFLNLNSLIQTSWFENFWHTNLYILNLILVNKVLTNLRSFLLFNYSKAILKPSFCKKCNLKNCKSCHFILNESYILLNDFFYLPILSHSNCNSIGCVYIIECKFCKFYYIGETGRIVKERIQEHIRLIIHHSLFKNTESEVAQHFNLPLHNYRYHFKYYVVKNNISNLKDRRHIENDMIQIIRHVTNRIINFYIPSKYKLKHLTFI